MNLIELKYAIARTEDCKAGIRRIENFKNKELEITSPDFSDEEKNTLYLSGEIANEIVDFMIQKQKDTINKHKEVLDKVLALIKDD